MVARPLPDMGVALASPPPDAAPAAGQSVSVVIVTRDEADALGGLLADLRAQQATEFVVVDGGSRDGTIAVARDGGATVVLATPCRGAQLHVGARATRGEILWFLHADVRLPPRALEAVARTAAAPGFTLGAFRIQLRSERRSPWHRASLRLISASANARSRAFGLPYGDAGLFLGRALYEELGGFGPLCRCEDLDLLLRIRDRGLSGGIRVVPLALEVSARRWDREGVWRTTIGHAREASAFMRSRRARTCP